jgi:hypothetical protein
MPCARPAGLNGLASNPDPGGDHITGGVSSGDHDFPRSLGRGRFGLRLRIPAEPTERVCPPATYDVASAIMFFLGG